MFIPQRFQDQINAHLLGNMLDIPEYPLILSIIGRPGMGKTLQLREHLKNLGVAIYSVSSADLESDRAGAPAKLLKEQYVKASANVSLHKQPSVIVIDDIDTTVGEWEQNTGTVNHQGILAFLMHIADNPYYIESIGITKRIPVFLTGNRYELLYEPLRRPGRMYRYDWIPNKEEKIDIVHSIITTADREVAKKLVEMNPDEPIAFFSSLYASLNMKEVMKLAKDIDFQFLLSNDAYKKTLNTIYSDSIKQINWNQIAQID